MIDTKIVSLLKVVETGNYTYASRELNLSQPAISQHIKGLEEEFGIKIFERANKKLMLTREGEVLVSYARRMQSLDKQLKRDLSRGQTDALSLNIGITHSIESSVVSEALAEYASRHKGITITLLTETASGLKEKLRSFEIDFAITDSKIVDSNFRSMLLDTDRLMLMVAPEHRLADKTSATIEDVKEENLILRLPHSGTRDLFMASLAGMNMSIDEFNVILEIDSIATIKDLLRRGYGVSVLSRSACMDEIRKKKIISLPIENLSMIREINFVYSDTFSRQDVLTEISDIYNAMAKDD